MTKGIRAAAPLGLAAAVLLSAWLPASGATEAPATSTASYTIRQIFAHPGLTGYSPRSLKWSPEGKHLSFLLGTAGSKWENLYVIDTASGKRKLLIAKATLAPSAITNTHAREEVERYHIGTYGWEHSGDAVYAVKNGRLWLYPVDGARARAVGPPLHHAVQPSVAPGGADMAWASGNMLYYAPFGATQGRPVAAAAPRVLTGVTDWVYREELGLERGYAWSTPHSRYLAFLRFEEGKVNRFPLVNYLSKPPRMRWQYYPHPGTPNPHVRLGFRNLAKGGVAWARLPVPAGGYIARFGWIPDAGKAYAEVLNRAQTEATLYVIDPATGAARELAKKSDRWWVDVDDTPRFLDDGRFVWSSNRDGWHHLYLYAADGRLIRRLTPGAYNVLSLEGIDAARGEVYFTRYQHGPLDTELYRVALSGGEPVAVTRAPGVHGIDMSRHGRYYVDWYSRAGLPPSVTLKSADGHELAVLKPRADLSRYGLRAPRFLTIPAGNGKTRLYAELFLPRGFDPHKRYPVIMYQYGGPDVPPIVRDGWGGTGYLFDELLNRHGFVVFATDNRAATYFSHRAQATIKYKFGPEELADQLAALKWVKSRPWADPGRIGIWGWSFGGYMTAYALTHAPRAWTAGIAVAPVTKWKYYDSIYTERYMGTPKENAGGYRAGSVVADAARLRRPLMIAAGTADDNVHWQNTLAFIQALINADKTYLLAVFPNKSHGITGTDDRTQLFTAMLGFWQRELGGRAGRKASTPSTDPR